MTCVSQSLVATAALAVLLDEWPTAIGISGAHDVTRGGGVMLTYSVTVRDQKARSRQLAVEIGAVAFVVEFGYNLVFGKLLLAL